MQYVTPCKSVQRKNDCLLKYFVVKRSRFKDLKNAIGELTEIKLSAMILHNIKVLMHVQIKYWT